MTSGFLDEVLFNSQIKHLVSFFTFKIIVVSGRRFLEGFCVWLVGHKRGLLENMLKLCREILPEEVLVVGDIVGDVACCFGVEQHIHLFPVDDFSDRRLGLEHLKVLDSRFAQSFVGCNLFDGGGDGLPVGLGDLVVGVARREECFLGAGVEAEDGGAVVAVIVEGCGGAFACSHSLVVVGGSVFGAANAANRCKKPSTLWKTLAPVLMRPSTV